MRDDIKEKELSGEKEYDRATWRRMSSYIDPTHWLIQRPVHLSLGLVKSIVGLAKICQEIILKYRHWIIFSIFVDIIIFTREHLGMVTV